MFSWAKIFPLVFLSITSLGVFADECARGAKGILSGESGDKVQTAIIATQEGDMRIALNELPMSELLERAYGFRDMRRVWITPPYSYADFKYLSDGGLVLKSRPFVLDAEKAMVIEDKAHIFHKGDMIVPFTFDRGFFRGRFYCHFHVARGMRRGIHLLGCYKRSFFKYTTKQSVHWTSSNSFFTQTASRERILKPYNKLHFDVIKNSLRSLQMPLRTKYLNLLPIGRPRFGFQSLTQEEMNTFLRAISVKQVASNTGTATP